MCRLTYVTIETVNDQWLAEGSSAATVRRRHSILSAALTLAERWGIIAASPARRVELPKIEKRTPEVVDVGPVLTKIAEIKHDRLRTVAQVAVGTGARRGELLGLRWCDVDLENGQIRITRAIGRAEGRQLIAKGTKTGSVKVLAIDAGTVHCAHRVESDRPGGVTQGGSRTPERPGPGVPVADGPAHAVAPRGTPWHPVAPRGTPWHPEHLTRRWVETRDGIGLAGVRFHDLRHLHATALLGAGIAPTAVAARLGHSTTQMLNTYGHAIPAHDRAAANVIGALGGTTN